MQDSVKITAAEVVELYKSIGKTPKQLASLTFEVSETPLSGIVKRLIPQPAEYQGNSYFQFEIVNEEGIVIGKLSVNRLFDSLVEKDDYIVVNSIANKGKAMLRAKRLSNLSQLGMSRAEQIANFIGKTYTAERVSGRVIDLYTPEKLFVPANEKGEVTKANKEKLWANTAETNRAFKLLSIQ